MTWKGSRSHSAKSTASLGVLQTRWTRTTAVRVRVGLGSGLDTALFRLLHVLRLRNTDRPCRNSSTATHRGPVLTVELLLRAEVSLDSGRERRGGEAGAGAWRGGDRRAGRSNSAGGGSGSDL